MKFTKMQGIGNDYIYVNCMEGEPENPQALSVKLSDRHFGIGSDGLILICPSDIADFRMRMFNADGSEGRMCGNGLRCFSRFVYDKGLTAKTEFSVETLSGIKYVTLNLSDGKFDSVCANVGQPIFTCEQIPVVSPLTPPDGEMISVPLTVLGREYAVTCVSMGNPHCVIFIDEDVDAFPLEQIGPVFETLPIFPERTNTEFVNILPDGSLKMRVWERGSGETLACGTGSCAVLAAAVRTGAISDREAVIHLRGGDLCNRWDETTGCIFMTGGAEFVFDGEISLDRSSKTFI